MPPYVAGYEVIASAFYLAQTGAELPDVPVHVSGGYEHIRIIAYLTKGQGGIPGFVLLLHVRHLMDSNGFLPRRGTSQRFP